MDRRTLLRRTAATGAALSLAGCLRRSREENALRIAGTNIGSNEQGYLTYDVTVSNVASQTTSGTVYVTYELNGETGTKVRQVTLEPKKSTVVTVTFDVKQSAVRNFSPSASVEES